LRVELANIDGFGYIVAEVNRSADFFFEPAVQRGIMASGDVIR